MDPRPPAARLAEHTFLQYQRLLQREVSEPELVIQLPNVLGDYGTMLSESADVAGVEFMELKVIIAFEALRPRCGMHFCGDWALSDNEVGSDVKYCRLGLPACHGVGRLHTVALSSLPGELSLKSSGVQSMGMRVGSGALVLHALQWGLDA